MALAIDGSSPAAVSSTTNVVTTASFTPPPFSLICVLACVGNHTTAGTVTGTVTDSLGGSFSQIVTQNAASFGWVSIRFMDVGLFPAARTITLTGSTSTVAKGTQLSVLVFTGAHPAANQPSNSSAHGNTVGFSQSMGPSKLNSYIVGALSRSTTSTTLSTLSNTFTLKSTSDTTNAQTYGTFRSIVKTTSTDLDSWGYSNANSGTQQIYIQEISENLNPPSYSGDTATATESGSVTVLSVPAPDYEETFDEGVAGATLSTSYGGIATYDTDGSGSKTYTSASVYDLAANFVVTSVSALHWAQTPASGTGARYIRFYFKTNNGFGGSNVDLFKALGPGLGFGYDVNGKAQCNNGSFTTTVADGNWWRVELDIDNTTTNAQVRIYSNPSSIVPTETQNYAGGVPATAYTSFRFGVPNTNGGATPNVSIDNIAVSSVGSPSIWMPTVLTGSDTGSSSESASLSVLFSDADAGSSSETAQVQQAMSAADTGSSSEASQVQQFKSAADTGTGTEAAHVGQSAADTGTGAEGTSVSATLSATDTGTGAESESVGYLLTTKSDTDSVTSVEASAISVTSTASDTVAATDAVSDLATATPLSDADGAAATESAAITGVALSDGDTATAGENWYSLADFSDSDSGSAVEAASRGLGADVADDVGLVDSISFSVGYAISAADSAGPTDATVPASGYRRATADTSGLADAFITTADLQRPLPDSVGIRDQGITHRFDYGRAPTDGVNLVETIVFALTQHAQDGVGLADNAARTWGLGTAASDPVGLADSTTTAWAGVRRWSDTVALADSVSFDIAVVVVDVASLQESVASRVGLTRTLTDTLRPVDGLTFGYGVTAEDAVGLEDDTDDSSALRIINEEDTATALDDFAVSKLYFDFQRISLLVDEDIPLMRTGNYR